MMGTATATAATEAGAAALASQAALGTLATSQAVLGVYQAFASTQSARAQAGYESRVAENNAKLAKASAADASKIGYDEAQRKFQQVNQFRGGQVATAAASGIDPTAGSTADLIKSTDYFGRADAQMIATNAGKQATGYEQEAQNYLTSSKMYDATQGNYSPGLSVGVSLLTSAGNIADKWLMNRPRVPSAAPAIS